MSPRSANLTSSLLNVSSYVLSLQYKVSVRGKKWATESEESGLRAAAAFVKKLCDPVIANGLPIGGCPGL